MSKSFNNMQKRDSNPFNRILVDSPGHNEFDLSFDNKLTLNMGNIVPVLNQFTIPGDHFTIRPEMLIRFAPMTFPIMHRIDATIHFFFVPFRILWKNFEKYMTDKKVAGVPYTPLYLQGEEEEIFEILKSSLSDYMGLPLTANMKQRILAYPYLAYLKIYHEYFQDQNNDTRYANFAALIESLYEKEGGRITPAELDLTSPDAYQLNLERRAWEHDYFTSCLPFAQKGDAVNIPLQLSEIVVDKVRQTGGSPPYPSAGPAILAGPGMGIIDHIEDDDSNSIEFYGDGNAILDGTINQLRVAMALQKFLETNARSGTRYNEMIKAHFNEDMGDARINRPEYLGKVKNNVVISEVLQTSSSTDDSALGDYAGYGSAVVRGNSISFKAPEHGIIMGLLSVIPKTAYMQGINKKFQRFNLLEEFFPEFAHIGEEAVKVKELYYSDSENDEITFGYQSRYSDLKYTPSEAHGDFRTSMLDFTLTRKFDNLPALNEDFIRCDENKRIFAVQDPDTDSLYSHIWFDIKASRKIPFFTNPGGI